MSIQSAFENLVIPPAILSAVQPRGDTSFWFMASREGLVYAFDNDADVITIETVLDITDRVNDTEVETGLTGIAFHPEYPADNRIFAIYNDATRASNVVSFEVNTTTRAIDRDSETSILTLEQPGGNHNGGDLAFDSDGLLYAAFGDGGEGLEGGTAQYAQRNGNLLGTVIRINVDQSPYGIPSDNPFNTGQARCNGTSLERSETCPEIYAYGLRNPWRMSIDMETDVVWVGDVGEEGYEEVNRIDAGANYGWPIMEGLACFGSTSCDTSGLSLPIVAYGRSVGQSVVGGYVYRGISEPELYGKYIYGDIYTSDFFTVDVDAEPGTPVGLPAFNSARQIFTMAQGSDGEVYLINSEPSGAGDGIFRVSGSGGVAINMPESLSDTGCFNTSTKASPSGIFDYQLIAPLWSDGAEKSRAFAIPDNTLIDILEDGDFDFPTDSVLIKHFLNGNTYLETRLFINHSIGWRGYSYEWNAEQTEATLLSEGKTVDVGDFIHIYPSRAQCLSCHTRAANFSLGLELQQLNRIGDNVATNIIDYLSDAGYLSSEQTSEDAPRLYPLDDTSASLEQRARSYLHSNCAGCHQPGSVFSGMDLRFSTPFAESNTCGVAPSAGALGISGALRIAPGNPDSSILLVRMDSEDPDHRMPNLGSLVVHDEAVSLIRDWITSLSGCD